MTTINHHPAEETLAAYVGGRLDEGRRVLVAAHVELCASCARMLSAADHIAGMRLQGIEPTPLEDDALSNALARIDRAGSGEARSFTAPTSNGPVDLEALAGYERGPWRWIGPGVHWRSVAVPVGDGARVFMLRAAPGTSLPHHTHTGTELTLILQGAFAHVGGRFGVGDFDEADGSIEHQPVVEPGDACICLVAMEGKLRLLGLLGRIMQPFVRM
jgi:putative transcriptional regulator